MPQMPTSRRDFLRWTAATVAIGGTFDALTGRLARGDERDLLSAGYGGLRPVKDEATGLELLRLPEGFTYRTFGWTDDPMEDGAPTPPLPDGMAVTFDEEGLVIMSRNHEISDVGEPFGKPAITYDARAKGGCTNLQFDTQRGEWVKSAPSLAGTVRNCAGGPTPWGTWLTCEESTLGPGEEYEGERFDYEKTHGWVFEVSPQEDSDPRPITGLGRLWHEAVAIDPETGIVYETEDRKDAGLYRFVPDTPGQLRSGGRLQMLAAKGPRALKKGIRVGQTFDVSWVDIEDPERADRPGTSDHQGVYGQGVDAGGSTFNRLEGAWYAAGRVYVTSTEGGDAEKGQVWELNPREQTLTLVFESPGEHLLDMPDNLCVSPRGGILLCEDGKSTPQRIHGLTPDGRIFTLAANDVDFSRKPYRREQSGVTFREDFRTSEWAGATFSRDGRWLFANLMKPGITFAITGPWQDGLG